MAKISQLELADPFGGEEIMVVVQGGRSKQTSAADHIAHITAEASAAAATAQALANYRPTISQGVDDFPTGTAFTSAESGQLRAYMRIAPAPYYEDLGDAVAPLTKALLGGAAGAVNLGYKQAGLGARLRTLLDRMLDEVYVTEFDVAGDDDFDDAPGIRDCIAAHPGKRIIFPSPAGGAYKLGSSLGEIPANTRLVGMSRFQTKLRRAYEDDDYLMILGNAAGLDNLWIDGDGGNFPGGGVQVKLGTGRQSVHDCRIINFQGGIPIHFPCDGDGTLSSQVAGSQSFWSNIEAYRSDSSAGLGRYAVVHDNPAGSGQTAGHPITFINLMTSGYESVDFGACNNFYVHGSSIFGLATSDRGVGVDITGGRISAGVGGDYPITLAGSGDMTGVHCYPQIILNSTPGNSWTINGGWQNSGYTDNNPNGSTVVYDRALHSYTPVFYGGGTPITLGNGSVLGHWLRNGRILTFHARLIVGTETVIPAGSITVSLPSYGAAIPSQNHVSCHLSIGGTIYKAAGRIASGELVARLERDTSGPLNSGSPAAIVSGSVLTVSGTYIR